MMPRFPRTEALIPDELLAKLHAAMNQVADLSRLAA